MDFVTLDFETATSKRASACELGITIVKNGLIKETHSWYIKPPSYPFFENMNVSIHGITPDAVKDADDFARLWGKVLPILEGQLIIAHNSSFDMSVLKNSLDHYSIEYPNVQILCSHVFSKKVWPNSARYDLFTLCRENGISFRHHRAGSDARATAELALKAFEVMGISSLHEIEEKLQTTIGHLKKGEYKRCETKRVYDPNRKDLSGFVGDPSLHNPENIFFGKSVMFTGKLNSMQKSEAHQKVVDLGGRLSKTVSRDTHYLVVGQQELKVVGPDGLSSKQRKAIELAANGHPIEILSEVEFLRSL